MAPASCGSPCFYCKQNGHWLRDCPQRRRSSPGMLSPAARKPNPELKCRCGRGACVVVTSKTGREYFLCPATPEREQCGFEMWCDEAVSGWSSPVKRKLNYDTENETLYPICGCHAGRCMLLMMQDGENAGRKYFACPIKKGQGACNFWQWYDEAAKGHETNNEGLGMVQNFNQVPDEPKGHEMVDGTTSEAKSCGKAEGGPSNVFSPMKRLCLK